MEAMDISDSPVSPRSIPSVSSSLSSAPDTVYDTQGECKTGPKKKTRKKVIYFWTSEDVLKWLRKHCGQYFTLYGEVFKHHDISGRTLVRLTDSKLQLLGVTNELHREELMRHILRLKLKTENQELIVLGQNKAMKYEKKT